MHLVGNKRLIKCDTIIDGTGREPIKNAGILIEDKTIKAVGRLEEIEFDNKNKDIEIIDYMGQTVIPGLIDCHVHILFPTVGDTVAALEKQSLVESVIYGIDNLKKLLHSGVTFFRDLGGIDYIELELKKQVMKGQIEGPDFLASGKLLTMTGGHGWQMGRECDGVHEVRKAAREQLKAGADIIKIMATGGVMTPGVEAGSSQLTKDEIAAAVIEAHKAGKKTASHAQGTEGIKNAILAGIDSIEHGIFLDDEVIELMVNKKVYLVPTLSAVDNIIKFGTKAGVPDYAVEKAKTVREKHLHSFSKARKAGVKIAMGTDAGTPFNHHGNPSLELKLMVNTAMTAMEAIVSATKTASELLGIDKSHGTLEAGKMADFIVLKKNPLEDIEIIKEAGHIYKNGKLVKQ